MISDIPSFLIRRPLRDGRAGGDRIGAGLGGEQQRLGDPPPARTQSVATDVAGFRLVVLAAATLTLASSVAALLLG